MLSIGVERTKTRVNWGRPASVGVVVLGTTGPGAPWSRYVRDSPRRGSTSS